MSSCWLWAKSKNPDGYGHFYGKMAHRYFYELWVNEIPNGLCVLHKCDNPPCINPQHLFLGTHRDNMIDKAIKGRGRYRLGLFCRQDHAYTSENTYINPGSGRKSCRICNRANKAVYRTKILLREMAK